MTLELEILVLAWDNYKRHALHNRSGLELEETNVETAINGLLDRQQPQIPRIAQIFPKLWSK